MADVQRPVDLQLSQGSGVGASNGTSRHAPFDRWFRYPAGFAANTVDALVAQRSGVTDGAAVLDPFCGAGTVGTRSAAHGLPFVGIEAHPEVAELARLKLAQKSPSRDDILSAAKSAVAVAGRVSLDGETPLVRRCFSDDVLTDLVRIREVISRADDASAPYLKWALLGALRDLANVKVGWPYLRPEQPRRPPYRDAGSRFLTRAAWIADDMEGRETTPDSVIVAGNSSSREPWSLLRSQPLKAALCITSPPYLNNFDYADATRLETYFWGRNRTWRSLCDDVRADMLVATTQQSSAPRAAAANEELSTHFPEISADIAPLVAALAAERQSRHRGKEYDRVLPVYMLGIVKVLENLASFMEPGSDCCWVVGDSAPYSVYIDTPLLIQRAAAYVGFGDITEQVLRVRGNRWRTKSQGHSVPLNERVIVMKTPLR